MHQTSIDESTIRHDYGQAAEDYARYRAGFPPRFFDRLRAFGLGLPGQRVIDVGCGTGTLALGFAAQGADVLAVDPSPAMVAMTRRLAEARWLRLTARIGRAEAVDEPDRSADLITCGQCWHWFDRPAAAAELHRILRPGGALVICHLDWLVRPDNPAGVTHALVQALGVQPTVEFTSLGIHPKWTVDVADAGFVDLETFSFEWAVPYDVAGWRGRIRASAWADPRLDAELQIALEARWPGGDLRVPHRVWALVARRSGDG